MVFSLQFRSSSWTILGRMLKDRHMAGPGCLTGHSDPSDSLVYEVGLEVLSFPLLIGDKLEGGGYSRVDKRSELWNGMTPEWPRWSVEFRL